jgi:hypothetical protein
LIVQGNRSNRHGAEPGKPSERRAENGLSHANPTRFASFDA